MPLYTYRCSKCNETKDSIVKLEYRNNPRPCEKCQTEDTMLREEFTPGQRGSNLYFRGNWFATKGRY